MWLRLQDIEERRYMNRDRDRDIDIDIDINIDDAFSKGKALIGFLTAGDPNLEKTKEYIHIMENAGVDLIEIGIPFSDPIAEGEVIQRANLRALSVGTTTDKIFEMVKQVRSEISVPLVFLTYINPIFVYGSDRFFENCKSAGISGVIIPDLPYEEKGEIISYSNAHGIKIITLIAPTSNDRIKMLAQNAEGFVYLVSSMGVTGVRSDIKTDIDAIVREIKSVTETKIAVGFGISTPAQAKSFAAISDGVIIGSAIVRIIEEYGENASDKLYEYLSEIKKVLTTVK